MPNKVSATISPKAKASRPHPEPSNTEESSTSSFLFVNRDQATIRQATRSRQVSNHVQLIHRKKVLEAQHKQNSDSQSSKQTTVPKRGGEVQSWRAQLPNPNRRQIGIVEVHPAAEVPIPTPGALQIQKGNSDPFSALPYPVDPITNKILSWYRDDGIPALMPMERAIFGSSEPFARVAWEKAIESIQSPMLAAPHLAAICAYMAWHTKSDIISRYVLQLKGRAYTALRAELRQPNEVQRQGVGRMMLDLFWSEQSTSCYSNAELHLVSIINTLKAHPALGHGMSAECLLELLTADLSLAMAKLSAPLMDIHEMAVQEVNEDWKVESGLLQEEALSRLPQLDESIRDAELRDIFLRLREVAVVYDLALAQMIHHSSVIRWLYLRLLTCESELLAFASVYESQLSRASADAVPTPRDLDYCACLAALAWVFSIYPNKLRFMKQPLASRLKSALSRCRFGTDIRPDLSGIALWSLYVGTLLEEKIETETGNVAARDWHGWRFVKIRRDIEYRDTQPVFETLGRFICLDHSLMLRPPAPEQGSQDEIYMV